MRLPLPSADRERDLREFDIWITPSLGEITETAKFKEELARIKSIIEALGAATNNFDDPSHCKGRAIAETFGKIGANKPRAERSELFKALASTLFLVTGKSDNNAKCQFPLYLRDVAKWTDLPRAIRNGGERSGVRLNATSDIPWESVSFVWRGKQFANVMQAFPRVQFYDYTKRANRRNLPSNYHLTFSLAEDNDAQAEKALQNGMNVAAVFNVVRNHDLPKSYAIGQYLVPIIDGDVHDYRPADDRFAIVGLRAKGAARHDASGFVRSVKVA